MTISETYRFADALSEANQLESPLARRSLPVFAGYFNAWYNTPMFFKNRTAYRIILEKPIGRHLFPVLH
jgi:hypothetical protein